MIPSKSNLNSRQPKTWPFPFEDSTLGKLDLKTWLWVILAFLTIHYGALFVSFYTGNFDPDPSGDHQTFLYQILEGKIPDPSTSHTVPLYAYYLAFKWKVTEAFGWPYWSGKFFVDVIFVLLGGILSIYFGQILTRNRLLSIAAGLGLVGAPIYIFAVAEDEAAIFFMPFFLMALILLVKELQRSEGPRMHFFAVSGLMMGMAILIRANANFLIIVLAPFIFWVLKKTTHKKLLPAILILAFICCQGLVLAPWLMRQRQMGIASLTPYTGLYQSMVSGLKRVPGNRFSDWVRTHYEIPERSPAGIIRLNLEWLKKDPAALIEFYLLKLIRAWYVSDTGKWDKPILLLHFPFWIFALTGIYAWSKICARDPAFVFLLILVVYMWVIAALGEGFARYSAPLYGFIGILAGIGLLFFCKKLPGVLADNSRKVYPQ